MTKAGPRDPSVVEAVAAEGMAGNVLAGLGIHPGDELFKHSPLHPPLPAPAQLDRWQLAGSDERVDLGRRRVEHLCDISQRQKSRLGHGLSLASDDSVC